MTEGLLAQWQRGIALRGIAGAALLMIPVLVAATIGFGGVGGGLTSLASGPSETAVATPSSPRGRPSESLDRLSASIRTATPVAGPRGGGGGGDTTRDPSGRGTANGAPDVEAPTSAGGSSGASNNGAGTIESSGTTVTPGAGESPPPDPVPATQSQPVGDLLQALLNQNSQP